MATAAAAAPPRSPRSFAGLLEEFASPRKVSTEQDLDGLEDDVATLSYEHALKTHGRYQRQPDAGLQQIDPAVSASQVSRDALHALPQIPAAQASPAPTRRKSASVTVRLTTEEDDRLRARAAEAGLTVSAYLRSCAFEVEGLRAQVKEAVAGMRQAEQPRLHAPRSWLPRLFRRSRHGA